MKRLNYFVASNAKRIGIFLYYIHFYTHITYIYLHCVNTDNIKNMIANRTYTIRMYIQPARNMGEFISESHIELQLHNTRPSKESKSACISILQISQ